MPFSLPRSSLLASFLSKLASVSFIMLVCFRVVGLSAVVIVQAIYFRICSTCSEAYSVTISSCSVRASRSILSAPEEISSNCRAMSVLVCAAAMQGILICSPFGMVLLFLQL